MNAIQGCPALVLRHIKNTETQLRDKGKEL